MGLRVQPAAIEIPEQDPFKNDLLGREEPAKVLTNLLRSIEGPCVLARIIHEGTEFSRNTNAPVWYKGCADNTLATTEALA